MTHLTRIGCFGGTFDPPHFGHIALVEELLKSKLVDKVLIIVAANPYHKDTRHVSDYADRVAMVRCAFAKMEHVEICTVEATLSPETHSYTYDTMSRVRTLYPDAQLILLMGSDSLVNLHTWHKCNSLVDTYDFIVYPRPGYTPDQSELNQNWTPARAQKLICSVQHHLKVTDLAATDIRRSPHQSTPFVPETVLKYIRKHALYTPPLTPLDRVFKRISFIIFNILCVYLFFTLCACSFLNVILFPAPEPDKFFDNAKLTHIPVGRDSDYVTLGTMNVTNPHYYLLYFHGNGEDIGDVQFYGSGYALMQIKPFMLDYRGYGKSSGEPTPTNYLEDCEAAYHYMVDSLRIPPQKIIVHGRSLGGAGAIYLAHKYPVRALIAESTFLSPFRVVTYYPIIPFDPLPNATWIREVKKPVLFMQGMRDGVIPFSHGLRLFEIANEPKTHYWHPSAGHNNLKSMNSEAYWNTIYSFIKNLPEASTDSIKKTQK